MTKITNIIILQMLLVENNINEGMVRMENESRFILLDRNSSKIRHINLSLPKIFIGLLVITFLIVTSLKISTEMMIKLNQNSKIAQLEKTNKLLEKQIFQMTEKLKIVRSQIDQIEQYDDQLRSQLDIPPLDADVRKVGIGGSDIDNFNDLELENLDLRTTIANNQTILDRLDREIKLESNSYKLLLVTAERKEDSLRYLPAIKPVPNGRLTDGFGVRRHPILKRLMPHHGIDLAAKRGTPILATADGYIIFTGRNGGYGKFVSIKHKYGFVTKYGHLQKIYVRRGQFVKRGDKIGEVGNTGLSTAPHLHYEVHYKGKPINPVNYYFSDIKFN
ncbi:MAG TPA: M23 family metallopeptidase [Caldithrix sp.]|nr:M23 family metallopeptidase [Caldithrix sp.]